VVDRDGEVEHVQQLQLQLVHLRVAHAAHAREEGVAVVAARAMQTSVKVQSNLSWMINLQMHY
jgi:hypothetical protein